MSMWTRVKLLFQMKTNAALDQAENVRETLDYAYGQQQEMLRKLRLGLVDVATSKRQLEQQVEKLQARVPYVEDQARRALAAEREDLARIALQRKQTALVELAILQAQLDDITKDEQKLTLAEQQLSARVEEFRTRRATTAARYAAAEARVAVNESLSGISGDLSELSMALGRAEEKTERLEARASAFDALFESGALTIPATTDAVERELRELATSRAIESDVAALKAELGQSSEPVQTSNGAKSGRESREAKL